MARKTKKQAMESRRQIVDAARAVFHERGVCNSTFETIARAAGMTRGAIHWHFSGKAELFLAVRENVVRAVLQEVDAIFESDRHADPLDAIEAALVGLFQILDRRDSVRMVLETIARGCEHVGAFSDVQSEIDDLMTHYLIKLDLAYRRAHEAGLVHPDQDAGQLALDTWAFAYGLLHRRLIGDADGRFGKQIVRMISAHMALRRFGQPAFRDNINTIETNLLWASALPTS